MSWMFIFLVLNELEEEEEKKSQSFLMSLNPYNKIIKRVQFRELLRLINRCS